MPKIDIDWETQNKITLLAHLSGGKYSAAEPLLRQAVDDRVALLLGMWTAPTIQYVFDWFHLNRKLPKGYIRKTDLSTEKATEEIEDIDAF